MLDTKIETREPSENYIQAGARFRSDRTESAPHIYSNPMVDKHRNGPLLTPGGSESSRVRFSPETEDVDLNSPEQPYEIELAKIESQKVYNPGATAEAPLGSDDSTKDVDYPGSVW